EPLLARRGIGPTEVAPHVDLRYEPRSDGDRERLDAERHESAPLVQKLRGVVALRDRELHELGAPAGARFAKRGLDEPAANPALPEPREHVHAEERRLVSRLLARLERHPGDPHELPVAE